MNENKHIDENFLIYTKAIANITYLTNLSQILRIQIDNVLSLYRFEGKEIIIQLSEKLREKVAEFVKNHKSSVISPDMFTIAILIVAHGMVNETVELLIEKIEEFAREELDLNIKLGVKRGDINYER